EARKNDQQNLVGQYILGAYQAGREEYLKLLLNQQSIDQSARTLRYYDYFNRARSERIAAYNATLADLRLVQEDIRLSTAALLNDRQQLGERLDELESGQLQRRSLLQELDQELASSGSELEHLLQELAAMELLIEELNRSIANLSLGEQQQAFEQMKGRLPWPAAGPLLNAFGARHDLGDLNWQGVTIAADEGEDVRAIHHGRVVFADWFSSSGLLLIIDHGGGYMSLYAHNQMLYHEVGDWVSSGEAVAAAGNTGGRRETGVYFEIRQNGRSVDPVAWCTARN
ncbi:MAG: peptidoglycan DD-metalloendopeptidase family protein, partial [Pseudohongiellaceae bacterium]